MPPLHGRVVLNGPHTNRNQFDRGTGTSTSLADSIGPFLASDPSQGRTWRRNMLQPLSGKDRAAGPGPIGGSLSVTDEP